MYNFEQLKYTYLHRKAFLFISKLILTGEDLKEIEKRAKLHDIDKMVLYTFMDKKNAHDFHVKNARHHLNNIKKTYYDYLEMIIDFECAALTKFDKPLNAYDTIHKYFKDYLYIFEPILIKLKINYSYNLSNSLLAEKFSNIIVSEKDIINEIEEFLKEKTKPV